jgi:hypothetical protein
MVCARCGFYRPKNSAAALFLQGKENLLRLQQVIPLTEAEANAIEDGVNAFEKLLAQLTGVPTPAVLLPGSFKADSFRSCQQRKGGSNASGMG